MLEKYLKGLIKKINSYRYSHLLSLFQYMHIYDAHTHLNEWSLYQEWEEYLQLFISAWGKWLINSWASEEYNINGITIAKIAAEKYPDIYVKTTLAWHPLEVVENIITKENREQKMQDIKKLYEENKEYIVGIGETGLDLYYKSTPGILQIQTDLLKAHCQRARKENLPLIIHSRRAFQETMQILKDYTDLTIYFHCRGYGPNEIEIIQNTFPHLFIGFCWNITYKKADELRESLKKVKSDQLVLETDAPYLSPQVVRGEKNHPANVQYIYETASEILRKDISTLSEEVENNVKKLYTLA